MNDNQQILCDDDDLQMARLRAIMHRLRAPGGCSWDAEQTHESLMPHMIEEAYEAVDSIRKGDMEHIKEELGDVLLQVVFHSEIAQEAGEFVFDDVVRGISEKLIRRHPHVYSDSEANDPESVLLQWDEIKKTEKGKQSPKHYLDGVGEGLPSLLKAIKIQKKASKVGFDWSNAREIASSIQEELEEVSCELAKQDEGSLPTQALKDEMGDLFFAMVNLTRKLKLNPEHLIERTNQKFVKRFQFIEDQLKRKNKTLSPEHREEMEVYWNEAKKWE